MAGEPTGAQHELEADGVHAVVTEVGGGLRSLRIDGRDVVAGFDPGRPRPVYRGSVLAPWPNRVGGGRYRWNGRDQQLALTEPDRRTALHGLLCWTPWTLVERTPRSVVLAARVWPQLGYPHQLDVQVGYTVQAAGLRWQIDAVNTGAEPAPYGCSVHPYLVAGPGRVDDWTFTLDAGRWLAVDDEQLLPLDERPVEGTPFDFRAGRRLGDVQVDHAFTGVRAGADGAARAELRAADGGGVAMVWDPAALPWVQVHTADRPEPELDRAGLAVEPMTCPPDALRTGQDLVTLAPGEEHSAWWWIGRLPA
ncbi:aldose 1-epimerase family protein [Modestobacter sp. SYSU DS0657]